MFNLALTDSFVIKLLVNLTVSLVWKMSSFDHRLLQLRPDTVKYMRKMHNLDKPGDMDRAVDVLEDWLKKQHHLTKRDYSRDFLEKTIIMMKGSVERAKTQIDKLCTMRTVFPQFFEKYDARNDFPTMDSITHCAILPKLTEEHYRVFVTRCHTDGITSDIFMEAFRFGILKCEYVKAHDYCNGFVGILDYRNISIAKFITAIDLIATHQLMCVLMEGYGLRIKGIHIVTPSKTVEALVRILRPMFGPKVSKRIHVHTKLETLYDYVSKDILPYELDGYEESMAVLSERWKNVLGTKENMEYLRVMSRAVSNEAYKIKEKLNALDLGISGTFRALNVD